MVWHDSARTRKAVGDSLEKVFVVTVACACGGRFKFVGDLQPGWPDFTCANCGRLVDVKATPQDTGNISVSAIPWHHYPSDMAIVTRIGGKWIGEYKQHLQVRGPYKPAHHSQGTRFKNTAYYLIPLNQFLPICDLDLVELTPNQRK